MTVRRFLKPVLYEDTGQYWTGQLIFWFILSALPFLGMMLWYQNAHLIYIEHLYLQTVLGLMISQLLALTCLNLWYLPAGPRMILVVALAGLAAAGWTSLRLITYVWLTGETHIWSEYGGWYFGAFYIYLCWCALYHGMNYYGLLQKEHAEHLRDIERGRNEQIKRLQAEASAHQAQLKMLRYQINPHFLFNTLHSIYALIRLRDRERSLAMLDRLGKFLRFSLEYDPKARTTLEDEVALLSLYVDIERVRFPERLRFIVDVSPDAARAELPSLLLQPLVENAIKYAVAGSENGASISVRARVIADCLKITVSDTGADVEPSTTSGTGVGLSNIRQRLEALFPDDHSLTLLENDPRGLSVCIEIPYRPESPHNNNRDNDETSIENRDCGRRAAGARRAA
ncbi:sensor histidine kinase [Marinimicrobium sp. ARAG 43.8]|uniref:sensor histidine kinase n=1 Tax=Marinimicrobium sp. ARAG 43.8 TaxID=3418719 RepID=UPI003CF5B8B7